MSHLMTIRFSYAAPAIASGDVITVNGRGYRVYEVRREEGKFVQYDVAFVRPMTDKEMDL